MRTPKRPPQLATPRCAAALWLVSLLSYCSSAGPLADEGVLAHLQGTFTALLGDANELTQVRRCLVTMLLRRVDTALRTHLLSHMLHGPRLPSTPAGPQETAARGVSLVYSRGGASLRSRLLGQLVGVLQVCLRVQRQSFCRCSVCKPRALLQDDLLPCMLTCFPGIPAVGHLGGCSCRQRRQGRNAHR